MNTYTQHTHHFMLTNKTDGYQESFSILVYINLALFDNIGDVFCTSYTKAKEAAVESFKDSYEWLGKSRMFDETAIEVDETTFFALHKTYANIPHTNLTITAKDETQFDKTTTDTEMFAFEILRNGKRIETALIKAHLTYSTDLTRAQLREIKIYARQEGQDTIENACSIKYGEGAVDVKSMKFFEWNDCKRDYPYTTTEIDFYDSDFWPLL